jgi:hypothetical protein
VRLGLLAACLLVVGCGVSGQPTPTPRSVTDVMEGLALRGATIHQAVSGDAGCTSATLRGNAVRLELTLQSDGQRYEVYLFRWRRPAQYDEAAAEFSRCVAEHETATGADEVQVIERPPWRAFGGRWSDDMLIVLDDSLRAAGAD